MSARIMTAALMLGLTLGGAPALAQTGSKADSAKEAPGAGALSKSLESIHAEWARIKYQIPKKEDKLAAIAILSNEAAAVRSVNPQSADAMIWEAIVLATDASIAKSMSGLPKVERAKELLEKAIQIDPAAQHGYAYTTLGSLYYQVPGWPISFGSKELAEKNFREALKIDPEGMDANFWYGEFLKDRGDADRARQHFEKALAAADRPGPEMAEQGRRAEIKRAMADLDKKGGKRKSVNQ